MTVMKVNTMLKAFSQYDIRIFLHFGDDVLTGCSCPVEFSTGFCSPAIVSEVLSFTLGLMAGSDSPL